MWQFCHSGGRAKTFFRAQEWWSRGGSNSASSGSASSAKTIESETSTTSATGVITATVTYSDGTMETDTSYGPPPSSSQTVTAWSRKLTRPGASP